MTIQPPTRRIAAWASSGTKLEERHVQGALAMFLPAPGSVPVLLVTSRVVKRALTGDGGSYRRLSSTAFATSDGSAASSARWSG